MLQKCHLRATQHAVPFLATTITSLANPADRCSLRLRIAKGLRVRIAHSQHRIAIRLEAAHKARGALVESSGCQAQLQLTVRCGIVECDIPFVFFDG